MTIYYTTQDIYAVLGVIAIPFALYLLRRIFRKYQQYKKRWTDMIEEKRLANESRLSQHESFTVIDVKEDCNEVLSNGKTIEEELERARETLENFSLARYNALDMKRIKSANPWLRNDLKLQAAQAPKQ